MEYCSVQADEKKIQEARLWIADEMKKGGFNLTDKELDLLTLDIMETSAMMGGGYGESEMRDVSKQYIDSNFYPRFLKLHRKELGGRLFSL